jgi:hypothetical protein
MPFGTVHISLATAPLRYHNAAMPRGARDALGGYCYHVLNQGNGRRTVFRTSPYYWTAKRARRMDLEASLRPRGRPRKRPALELNLFGVAGTD